MSSSLSKSFEKGWKNRGYRTCPDHPYMPRSVRVSRNGNSGRRRAQIWRSSKIHCIRLAKAAHKADKHAAKAVQRTTTKGRPNGWKPVPPRSSSTRNCASLNGRLILLEFLHWWGEKQAQHAAVMVLPVVHLPSAMVSAEFGWSRDTVRAALLDLARWGLVVYRAGSAYEDTVVGLPSMLCNWSGPARAVLAVQRQHPAYRDVCALLMGAAPIAPPPLTAREDARQRGTRIVQGLLPGSGLAPAEAFGHGHGRARVSGGGTKNPHTKAASSNYLTLERYLQGQEAENQRQLLNTWSDRSKRPDTS